MVAKKKTTSKKSTVKTTALAQYDEELAKYAGDAAEQEANTLGGSFFSTQGGILKLDDNPLPNNEMAVIIVDSILANTYYEGAYDPDEPQPISCYAFGRVEDDMKPHEKAPDSQSDNCGGCPHAEFGSANQGKGKACTNRRRIAMIPAGTFDKDGDFEAVEDLSHFENAEAAYLSLPPTSLKNFGKFVKQMASTLKRPPFAVFTKVKIVPDPKSQFKIVFELIQAAPTELIPTLIKRHEAEKEIIDFPYISNDTEPKKGKDKSKGKGKSKGKPKRGRNF